MSIISIFDALFNAISRLLAPAFWFGLPERFFAFADFIRPYSTVFSLLLMTGITYCYLRRKNLEEEYEEHVHKAGGKEAGAAVLEESANARRWEKIIGHLDLEKESEWRLAILEADILLDEMITNMGYHGDSLGEKLKGIEKSDFTTLDLAWEAHAIRNKIAHEGAAFSLTEREAKRVIGLYEEVFKEFRYI